jgi:hypothetical protein
VNRIDAALTALVKTAKITPDFKGSAPIAEAAQMFPKEFAGTKRTKVAAVRMPTTRFAPPTPRELQRFRPQAPKTTAVGKPTPSELLRFGRRNNFIIPITPAPRRAPSSTVTLPPLPAPRSRPVSSVLRRAAARPAIGNLLGLGGSAAFGGAVGDVGNSFYHTAAGSTDDEQRDYGLLLPALDRLLQHAGY